MNLKSTLPLLGLVALLIGCGEERSENGARVETVASGPLVLSAKARGSTVIDLVWSGSADEAGFQVERSEDGINFEAIATVSAETHEFTDAGLASETEYSYRVRAAVLSNVNTGTTEAFAWNLPITQPAWDQPEKGNGHAAIYDEPRNRMVLFGGTNYPLGRKDLWVLSLAHAPFWTRLEAEGNIHEREGHSAIYDRLNQRMVVFGGMTRALTNGSWVEVRLNDTWFLNLGDSCPTWTEVAVGTGKVPTPRFGHRAVYDEKNHRMLIFGGWNGSQDLDDVWSLDLSSAAPSWSRVSIAPDSLRPAGRRFCSAVYDRQNVRMIVLGGLVGASPSSETWALGLSGEAKWESLPSCCQATFANVAVYDPENGRMVSMIGSQMMALNLAGDPRWERLFPAPSAAGSSPQILQFASAIYDGRHRRMVLFGGWGVGSQSLTNDGWFLPL